MGRLTITNKIKGANPSEFFVPNIPIRKSLNCTNQVSCTVGRVVVGATAVALALIPAVGTVTAVAINATIATTHT